MSSWWSARAPVPGGALRTARRRIGSESLAGVMLAALCLPLNLGYAEAAGLPVSAGLNAAILPLLAYALFAGSRHLVIGPDATIAAFMAVTIPALAQSSGVSSAELASGLSALVGLVLLAFWALNAGGVVRYLSRAVLVGFIAGLAIEVLTSQVRKILAVHVDADGWIREVVAIVRELPHASVASIAVGVSTIVLLRLFARRAPRLPAALITLGLVTIVVHITAPEGVAVLGDVPSGLPGISLPTFGLGTWLDLLPTAVAIGALTVAEALLLAKGSARRHDERFDANAELFPLGLANYAGAVSGAMPCGGSASRTAALDVASRGGQLPSLVAAVAVAVVAVAFSGVVGELPTAALAGLVANAVVSTIEVEELRYFARVRRGELVIALVCAGGVLTLGPLQGIVVAVLMSVVDVIRRAADAPWATIAMSGDDPGRDRFGRTGTSAGDGLLALRPGGPLFFANAEPMQELLAGAAAEPDVDWVLLDFERVSDVDPTAATALADAVRSICRDGRVVALSRVDGRVLEDLDRYGVLTLVGAEHVYASNRDAERAHRLQLGETARSSRSSAIAQRPVQRPEGIR